MQVLVYTRSSNEYLKYTGKKKSNSFVNIKKYIVIFYMCMRGSKGDGGSENPA